MAKRGLQMNSALVAAQGNLVHDEITLAALLESLVSSPGWRAGAGKRSWSFALSKCRFHLSLLRLETGVEVQLRGWTRWASGSLVEEEQMEKRL